MLLTPLHHIGVSKHFPMQKFLFHIMVIQLPLASIYVRNDLLTQEMLNDNVHDRESLVIQNTVKMFRLKLLLYLLQVSAITLHMLTPTE